jgi:hypothetical protein
MYASPKFISVIISMMVIWAGQVVHMRDMQNAYNIFVGKPEGMRPLSRLRCRWEDNIKM